MFCPNGIYFATRSRYKTVGVWNVQIWRRIGHELIVTDMAFSPCGNQLASSIEVGTVRLWEAGSRNCVWTSPHVTEVKSVSFASAGERIIASTREGTVYILDAFLGLFFWTNNEREQSKGLHRSK